MLEKQISLLVAGNKTRDLAKAVVTLELFVEHICFQLFWGAPLNIHQQYRCPKEGKGGGEQPPVFFKER